MSAAAYSLPVDRQADWLEELKRIVDQWDALSDGAHDAVAAVVESLANDPESSESDRAHARALLAGTARRRLRRAP